MSCSFEDINVKDFGLHRGSSIATLCGSDHGLSSGNHGGRADLLSRR